MSKPGSVDLLNSSLKPPSVFYFKFLQFWRDEVNERALAQFHWQRESRLLVMLSINFNK